jgi:type I restriction enzyme S subunit
MNVSFGAFCAVLRPTKAVDARYFGYFLRSDDYRKMVASLARGVNINNLKRSHFAEIQIPLPPLAEQQRIADKLDVLLGRVDACRARLDRVPAILKRFRQAVLAAATSGRLTEGWREKNHASDSVPNELKSFDELDTAAFRDYLFPSTWQTQRLEDLAEVVGGVTKDAKKQDASFELLPYLRVANVQRGYLDLAEMKTIRVPPSRVTELLLQPGDILFTEGGDLDKLGRGWIWSGEIERCTFQNHIFRARLYDRSFSPEYFSYYGNFRGLDYFLAAGKQTTNLASINRSMLCSLPVAVPPADEQHEIVRRVKTLFACADRLEARYAAAREQVEQLTPSLLAKAFRGELVEQNLVGAQAEEHGRTTEVLQHDTR